MCLAVPGKILDITEQNGLRLARVQFGGVVRQVSLDFVPEAAVGEHVIVHVGFAISRIDEDEARRTYEMLEEMGVLEGELSETPEETSGFDNFANVFQQQQKS